MSTSTIRVAEPGLPAMVVPADPGSPLEMALAEREYIEQLLHRYGAVLLRDFGDQRSPIGIDQFTEFVTALSGPPLDYHERSTPRHPVQGRVFTATDHPARLPIFSHNELSYSLTFPARLHFFCEQPAAEGGATTLADSRRVLARVPDRLRDRLVRQGYRYVRNLRQHVGLAWQEVLQTGDRAVAERYCAENAIELTWLDGDEARTEQLRDVVAHHPVTGDESWFNHCAFFHVTTVGPERATMLRAVFGEDGLPNQTYFGDGEPIPDRDAASLRDAYTAEVTEVRWQAGDVLIVDNLLASHGRTAYRGERRVVAALTGALSREVMPR